LWLTLFKARTEEELKRIEKMEEPIMGQAIGAYRRVTATKEFKELERLRERARYNEASAIDNAERKEREKWQGILADKDAAYTAALADRDAAYTAALADRDAENEQLRKLLAEFQNNAK